MIIDEKGTMTASTCLRGTLNYATILYNEVQHDRLLDVLKYVNTISEILYSSLLRQFIFQIIELSFSCLL